MNFPMFSIIKDKLKRTKIGSRISYILTFNRSVIDEWIKGPVKSSIEPDNKILNAGAGSVRYKKYFPDCTYKTQDFKQLEDESGKFEYGQIDYVSDITDIPVKDDSFDVVICTEVFEHLPRPDLAVKEFARVLRSDGKLFLTTPLGSGVHQQPFHYYGGFSRYWFNKYLGEYGFSDVSIQQKGNFFAWYAQETRRAFSYFENCLIGKIFRPILKPVKILLTLFLFYLDRFKLDKKNSDLEFTIGYMVKALK